MLISKRKVYKRHRCRNRKTVGFTMVEVIVAMAVLSTSMLAVFGVLRMCVSADSTCQRLTESVFLAEKLLAETAFNDKITYRTTMGSSGQFSWQIQTAPTGMVNLAAVSIQVQWFEQQKPREYRLYSLMHIPALMEGK
jgi:prepilin-type N-terminal cleavage/methylation domain-containing protein